MRVGGVYMHHRVGYIYIIIGFIAITYRNYYEHVILEEYIKLVKEFTNGTI